jgi:hypothetical protein
VVDLFEQVEEELRVEQYKRIGQRILPWIIGLVVAVLVIGGGYIGYSKWRQNSAADAAEKFEKAMQVGASGDEEATFKAFGEIAASAPAGYKALALMHQAGIRLQQGDEKQAVALFDAAAKAAPKGAVGDMVEDAARLKSALALLDDAPYAQLEGRLTPLTQDGRPYQTLAQEALAIAKLQAGKTKEAREDFVRLSVSLNGSGETPQRARAAIGMIDAGTAGAIPAAVKAAKAAPPPMQIPPELLEQLQAQGVQVPGAPAQ